MPTEGQVSERLYEERRAKLERLRELGVDPYGGRWGGARPVGEVRASSRRLHLVVRSVTSE